MYGDAKLTFFSAGSIIHRRRPKPMRWCTPTAVDARRNNRCYSSSSSSGRSCRYIFNTAGQQVSLITTDTEKIKNKNKNVERDPMRSAQCRPPHCTRSKFTVRPTHKTYTQYKTCTGTALGRKCARPLRCGAISTLPPADHASSSTPPPPPEPGCPCQKNSNTEENLSRHRLSPLVSSDSRKYIFCIAPMYSPDR
ncbi:hypothetical protein AGLY_010282 [Aphis glycines]|uniref:Uncharacterized protein n=1 Tax=Aphis glycines TaxID=307491 RepID=A0A6G0THT4_APHGL|nr:hypothetical protein AGLY_010282 [Aphis glycines]